MDKILKNLTNISTKQIEDNIKEEDILTYISFLKKAGERQDDDKILRIFNSTGKTIGLHFLMHSFYSNQLITKTDLARSMVGISRDGALKFIKSMLNLKVINIHRTKADARKLYVMPNKILLDSFHKYIAKRLSFAHTNLSPIQVRIYKKIYNQK